MEKTEKAKKIKKTIRNLIVFILLIGLTFYLIFKDFIACYCRLNIVDEPAEQWRNAEMKRLASLQELMYYGGI